MACSAPLPRHRTSNMRRDAEEGCTVVPTQSNSLEHAVVLAMERRCPRSENRDEPGPFVPRNSEALRRQGGGGLEHRDKLSATCALLSSSCPLAGAGLLADCPQDVPGVLGLGDVRSVRSRTFCLRIMFRDLSRSVCIMC